jgi:hypothetical protein
MNILLKPWTTVIKDECSKCAETHVIIITDQQDDFRLLRSIHDALTSIITIMEEAKICNKDMYIKYVDFKGAFSADHRIIFLHMRQLGMLSTFLDTSEQLYGVSTTNYNTPTALHHSSTLTEAT